MHTQLKADLGKAAGTIRRIHGGNLGPNINHDNPDADKQFADLEVPITRIHDAPLANPGMRMVDVQHIFANWNADVNDERNYFFTETDRYLQKIRESGSEIMYRLGTSIEFSNPRRFSKPPADFEKWSDICLHIIRHYNAGWANGFHWNITYWELWNEPDDDGDNNGSYMWHNGTCEQFCRLYEIIVKKFKAEFPDIKFGGASFWKWHNNARYPERQTFAKDFVRFCAKKRLPLDFFSWHRYSSPELPFDLIEEPAEIRKFLDEQGFTETELHNTEWHYIHQWGVEYNTFGEHPACGIAAAAHYTSVLTDWQDTPIDMGYFYTIGGSGSFSPRYIGRLNPLYYAMLAFTKITHYPNRIEAVSDKENVRVLGGTDGRGGFALLISDFMSGADAAELELKGKTVSDMKLFLIDRTKKMEEVPVTEKEGKIMLPMPAGDSCVYLLTGKC